MLYEFKPYTSCPPKTDKNFLTTSKGGYSHCIDRGKGYTLPNCVAYCHGEWLHLLTAAKGLDYAKDVESKMCRNNAEVYANYDYNKKTYFGRGKTPVLGAIIVWEGKGSLAGHVAIVTEVKSNGDIKVNASNYSGSKFYTASYKKSNNYSIGSSYTFKCFIYPPVVFAKEFVTSPGVRNTKADQVSVSIRNLNVRTDHNTKAHRQGYCAPGVYDVLEEYKGQDYTWYRIDEEGLWIAAVKGVEYLPKEMHKFRYTIEDVPEESCEELETAIDNCGFIFKREEI